MDLLTHIREAIINLFSAKLRSFLAILGILVGTGSVVALILSSRIATEHALSQFKSLGTNLLAMTVEDEPSARGKGAQVHNLELADLPAIAKASDEIVEVAPYITLYQDLVFAGKSFNGAVLGATDELFSVAKITVSRGRIISELDKNNNYCVIGANISKQIEEKGVDPLYKQIQIGKVFFTIIGIANPWTPNLFLFADINNGAIIPLRAAYLLSSYAQIHDVLFRLVAKPDIAVIQKQLIETTKVILPDKKIDFRNPEQIIQVIAKQRTTFTWLLGTIGGISLLVGGIGVMNIMLVSVVERRREIGIRMAIGARGSDILKMFLIEAVILTIFGGLVGIFFGISASYILASFNQWEFQIYLLPPLLGFTVSVLVGILSGFYPAYRAAKVDPIQSLQSE